MGVGIDEAGQADQADAVDPDGSGLELDRLPEIGFSADEDDPAVARGDPPVRDHGRFAERRSALGDGSGAGDELAAARDDEIGLDHGQFFRSWECLFRMKDGVS